MSSRTSRNHKRIGIALGSGGARGLVHIGILEVLLKNGFRPEFVAGSSIGAIVGAYYALHGNIYGLKRTMLAMTRRQMLRLSDFGAPSRGLMKGERIREFLDRLYRGKSFSQTKLPLAVVATDLATGEEVIMRRGKIVDAVMASITIPGILPPVRRGRKILVDGGLTNPTPVDVVEEMGAEIVVGVDLTFRSRIKFDKELNILETLTQSFEVLRARASIDKLKRSKAVIVHPKFRSKLDSYRFYEADRFIRKGMKEGEKLVKLLKIKMAPEENQ
ncbi:patatin family protein [Candidatus Woesearchaeota archaeon]|nr:MAG: patatin family protein [Candidatus Woesearchaeota archaeon]